MNLTKDSILVKDTRNYGADLLKIIAMFLVVFTHVFGLGGVFDPFFKESTLITDNLIAGFFRVMSFCCVNCYALISGYVNNPIKLKLSKIINLWFQVVFYSFGIELIFCLSGNSNIGIKELFDSCMPFMTSRYWYFTAYTILFFFMPLINRQINMFSVKKCMIILISVLCFTIIITLFGDKFDFNSGYSFAWIFFLYIVGICLKKVNPKIKGRWALLLYFLFSIISCCYFVFLKKVNMVVSSKKLQVLFKVADSNYNTVFCLLIAIFLVLACVKFSPKRNITKKILRYVSGSTFGIYIIHIHARIAGKYIINSLVEYAHTHNIFVCILLCLGISLLIYVVCGAIDLIRMQLFKLLKIKQLSLKIEKAINNILDKLYDKVLKRFVGNTESQDML